MQFCCQEGWSHDSIVFSHSRLPPQPLSLGQTDLPHCITISLLFAFARSRGKLKLERKVGLGHEDAPSARHTYIRTRASLSPAN